jgi:hypothetical protein
MNRVDAIGVTRSWLRIRQEVRRNLIEAAREAHPHRDGEIWESSEIRKLYQYPSDLSEERLMRLAGKEV